uniref:ARM repeat superfamily protein n=1 Tax=Chenopodium quinoa TaxID=63459 RepID=A0A803L0R3_CHEQI
MNSIYSSFSSLYSDVGVSKGGQTRKGRGNESAEVKMELKISCAKALWMLANDSVANSHRITETKGLLSLAKLIERETGELRKICVMAVMEITLAAESKADLRRSAFKTSSPAGKAVVVQLVRVIKESSDPALQIAAIKSIGCLSRTFSAKETRVIGPLVEQLSSNNHEVGTEAAVALAKFVDPENFLCHEHSKAIIEFDGVVPLLRLLRESERAQVNGLVLLCHLAINAGNSEALERARLLTALEGTDRNLTAQYPQLRELIVKAMYHLGLYHGDAHPLRQASLRI